MMEVCWEGDSEAGKDIVGQGKEEQGRKIRERGGFSEGLSSLPGLTQGCSDSPIEQLLRVRTELSPYPDESSSLPRWALDTAEAMQPC